MDRRLGDWDAVADKDFVEAFRRRGESYEKSLPDADKVYVMDFFSGCGALSWGFENTRQSHLRFEVLGGFDIDRNALSTYGLNLRGQAVNTDVRDIAEDPSVLSKLIDGFDPDLMRPLVFVGGPPCQGFSAHRKKDRRDDERNDLVMVFAEIIAAVRPDVFVIENVPEMLNGRYAHYYEKASATLAEAGYKFNEGVLDLSLFGVPQRRQRAVVLGSLEGSIALPLASVDEARVRTVRDAIGHLRPVFAGEADPDDPWHRAPAHRADIVERISRIPPDGGDRRDLSDEDQLECHRRIDAGSTPGFTDVYGRLRWDRPSVTITAKSSTPSCGRFLHPEQDRNITVREAALLQTFPHTFVFAGPFTHQYRQIGEAVPPLFAQHLAKAVLDHFRPLDRRVLEVSDAIESAGQNAPHTSRSPDLVSVDLFCGAGGLSLGFEAAGIPSALAVDNDIDAVTTFAKNVSASVIQDSVLNPRISRLVMNSVGDVPYVLVGGPPCQGFSQQRRGVDADERNNLVPAYAELAVSLGVAPAAVVLENVMYLDSPRGRSAKDAFTKTLEQAGYAIFRHDLNSAEYGLPQLRRRIVIVAVRRDLASTYSGPTPVAARRWRTIGETLEGLGFPDSGELDNHISARESEINVRRMAFVDMGRGRTAIPHEFQLDCHRRYDGHLDVFGRLDWFGFARTVTGGFDSSSRGEYGHPLKNRSITAREAARIQGFPDWFSFSGNKAAVRRQIGNAVPPPLAYSLAQAIRQAL